ncbi:MAG: nickel-dependent lactate racemase [Blautia sp.]|jgi:nickel-dependent lactate racemase
MYRVESKEKQVVYTDEEERSHVCIDRQNFMGMYLAESPKALQPEEIPRAVREPVDEGERLSAIVGRKHGRTAAIIISDATRGVPTEEAAAILLEELEAGGIRKEDVVFVVALGVHRDATKEEIKGILGHLAEEVRVENHNAYEEGRLVYLGNTSRGTPVKINRTVYDSDIVVTIGKVELHDMAGFSGGPKSILPGVAGEETILINHRPEMIVDPGSRAGNFKGNPIHEDMAEAAAMCGVDYAVSIVMNGEYQIAGIFSGNLTASHEAAAEFVKGHCMIVLPRKPDIYLVCPGKPLNIDMYQGVKALIALRPLLEAKSTVILYGQFQEGINSDDFFEPFLKYPDLRKLKKFVWEHYRIQMDHIVPIQEILQRGVRVLIVSENVSAEDIKAMHMEKCDTLQEALDTAILRSDAKCPQVAICPQSWRSLFCLKDKEI